MRAAAPANGAAPPPSTKLLKRERGPDRRTKELRGGETLFLCFAGDDSCALTLRVDAVYEDEQVEPAPLDATLAAAPPAVSARRSVAQFSVSMPCAIHATVAPHTPVSRRCTCAEG